MIMKKLATLSFGLILLLLTSTNAYAQPANDNCAGAVVVTPDGTCVPGTTVAATDNWTGVVGCQAGGGNHEDVWYSFVSTGTVYTGTITVAAPWAGTIEFTLVSSATGCAGPFTIEGSACGASPLAINIPGLTNGATYYFTISNPNAGTPGPFNVCSTTSSPAASCVDNEDCSTPDVITYTTGVQTCLTDCNTGAIPGPDFAGNNCQDFPNSTVWYEVTTGANSATIDIDLTSAAMPNPYFSVFTTSDCLFYTTVNCTQGAAGSASATVPVAVNTTYLIAVSNDGAATGNFDLCITVNDDNSACNTTNALTVSATSMGSPLAGPYQPGEIVSFCYTITNWQQVNCNWLQGIVPAFGDCWDPVSFNAQGMPVSITTPLTTQGVMQPCPPGPPCPWATCVGTPSGTWSWFPAGAVTYNAVAGSLPAGSAMPAGWYFLSSYNPATGACVGDPTDPDNSYGDGNWPACGTNTMDWTVCFQLQAKGAIACTDGTTNCAVTINTYADGEIGVWNSVGCTADASGAAAITSNICCTEPPIVTTPVTYCLNDPATPLTATGTGLLWYTAATGGVGSATAPTPSTAVAGSTNYYVSSSNGGCESARTIITVTVSPNSTITLTSAAATANQTVCVNTAITNITYTVGGTGTGAGVVGLPAGVSGSFSGATFTISGTPTATGTFNYTVTTTGTCPIQATATGTIIVNPDATITLTSAAATTNQTVCVNNAITNITYSVGGGGTGAGVVGLPAGVTGSFAGGVFTISGTPTASGTFNYTVTTTGTCTQATATGTIIVNPNATITLTSAAATTNQTICLTAAITNITYSVGGGGTGAGVVGLPAGITGSFAGGTFTISGTPTATGTFNYTVTTTGTCTQATATGTIIVNPNATITLTSAAATTNQTLCSTTPITNITYTIGGSGTGAGVVGLPAGVTGSFAGGTYTISGTPTASGTFNYTVTTTGTCTQATATGTITVNPMQSSAFSYSNSTFCQTGTNPTPTITGTAGGTFSSTAGLVFVSTATGQINLSGSALGSYVVTYTNSGLCPTSSTFNITITTAPSAVFSYAGPYCQGGPVNPSPTFDPGASAGTFSSTAGLVFVSTSTGEINLATSTPGTYNVTNFIAAADGCSAASSMNTITINPAPVATFSYTGTPYCQNAANPSPTFSGGGVAGTFSSTAGLVFVSAATGEVNLSGSTPGTYTVTNTIAAAIGCSEVTATSTITITPLPVAAFSYTGTPYCQNAANPSPTFSGGGVAGTFSSTAGLVFVSTATGEVNLSGSTPGTYTVTNTIAAAGGCPVVTETSTITITPLPVATFSYTGTPYCQNAADPSPAFSGGGVAGTFSSTAGLVFVSTATGEVNLSGSTPGTYTVTNTIAAAGGCPAVTETSTITITPLPVATFSYTGTPYCQDAANPSPVFSGGGVAGTFSSTAGLIFVSTATGEVDLSGSTAGTYTVTNTIAAASGCPVVTATSPIVINPLQSAAFSYSASTFCQTGSDPTPTITGTPGGTFTSTAGLSINAATGTINLVASTLNTYTVTYTTPGPCPGSATFDVTIATAPSAAFSYAGPYCQSGSPDPLPSFGAGSSAGVFSSTAGLSINSVTGEIDLSASTPGTYMVSNDIAAGGGCAASSATASVTIDPVAVVSAGANDTICEGSTYALSGTMNGSTSSLTWSSATGGTFDNAALPNATYTPSATDIANGSVDLVITSDDPTGPCGAVADTITLFIDPPPVVNAGNDTTICEGGQIMLSCPFPVVPIIWTSTGTGTFTPSTTVLNPVYTPSPADILAGTVSIGITGAAAGSCPAVSDTMVVTINPQDDASFNYGGTTFCVTGPDPAPAITGTPGGTFTSASGITLDPSTGVITLSSTTLGTYTITYTTNGICPAVDSVTVTITNSPSAAFSYAGPYCQSAGGTALPAFGVGSGGGVFSSVTGLSLTGGSGQIDIALSTPGTYTVYNNIAASGGCAASVDSTVIVIDQPATVNAGLDTAICSGTVYNTSGTVGGSGTSLTWSTSGSGTFGSTTSGVTSYSYSSADSTAGNVMLIITSDDPSGACNAVTDTMILTINALPNADAGLMQTLACGSSSTVLSGSSTSAGAGFSWTGPGIVSGGSTVTPTVNAVGTYTLTVTSGACSYTDTVSVISNTNAPNVDAGSTQTLTCTTPSAILGGASGTAGATFSWSGAGIVSGGTTATPVINASGTYTLTVTDPSNSCTSTDTVLVVNNTTAPVADAGSIQTIGCGVSSATLDGSASGSGVNIVYNWTTINGNITSGAATTSPTVDLGGLYTITVTDNSNGCTATDTVSVLGAPSPDASFTANPTSGAHPLTVNFTNTSQNANVYTWDFGDGSIPFSGVDASDIYTLPGTYTVMLIASNNGQCPDTAFATVIVFDDFSIVIPNIFTPNGDNVNDQFVVTSTGAESLEGAIYDRWGLKIYDWHQLSEGWDGRTQSGVLVADGTYYYIINVKGQDGKEHSLTGFIQLVR
jgi:gliding motility-associated-like protein